MSKVKRKKRSSGGLFPGFLSVIVICAALALGMTVFFKVSKIEVSGAMRYTQQEIIDASGVKKGSNLVMLNCEAAQQRLCDELIYIGKAKITRKLPNKVIIEVRETGTVAIIDSDEGRKLIDSRCRVLENADDAQAVAFVNIAGLSAVKPKIGEVIGTADEDKPKVEYLAAILSAMEEQAMLGDVSTIDISNTANAQFDYLGRFKVKLGGNQDTQMKLARLTAAVKLLGEQETGSFDLSKDKKASFSPST